MRERSMPNKNLKEIFKRARKERWAIGQFNISNLETLLAIVQAAKNLKAPVIIGTSEGESKFIGLRQAAALVKSFKENTGLPIFLNLDHGKNLDYIREAIDSGYDGVHFDGSELPLEENIKRAKEIVKIAEKKGVLVEGEVGVIGGELTRPKEAKKFVKATKIDSLAINIGTWHGLGQKAGINFQRLQEINGEVRDVPLALHGGSGVPDSHIKKAIALGITKININTELRMAFTDTLKLVLAKNPEEFTPYKYMAEVITAIQKVVENKIKLFGYVKFIRKNS